MEVQCGLTGTWVLMISMGRGMVMAGLVLRSAKMAKLSTLTLA